MGQAHSRSSSISSTASDEATQGTHAATLEELYQAVYDAENGLFKLNGPQLHGDDRPVIRHGSSDIRDPEISDITRPGPAPHIHHLSELIDPYDLLSLTADSSLVSYPPFIPGHYGPYPQRDKPLPITIETPSGGVLSAAEFVARPDRPLAIRERQESIQKALERAQRDALRRQTEDRAQHNRKGSKSSYSSARSKSRKGSDSSTVHGNSRKGSGGSDMTTGSYGSSSSWEQMRVQEGKRDYDDLLRKKQLLKEKAKGTGIFNCFNE